jgi:multidrug resistance efflux pump
MLNSARLQFETMEADHARFTLLYEAGGMSRNDLRQSETALTHAQNAYNDAITNYNNAVEMEGRALEQLELALYAAISAHSDAVVMLETTRLAANQEIDMLRSNLTTAQIAANMEPMEIAVNMATMEITSNLTAMENAIQLELTQLNAAVEATEISLQLLERQLADSVITSPINGTVTNVIAREGAVGMGPLFVVNDMDNLRIITSLREYDIALIETGMEVSITADATGNAVHAGTIRRINPAADLLSPIVEFEVEIAIDSQDTGLLIGMNTRIEIDLE